MIFVDIVFIKLKWDYLCSGGAVCPQVKDMITEQKHQWSLILY